MPDAIRPRFAELAAASHVAVQSGLARAKRLWLGRALAPNNCKEPNNCKIEGHEILMGFFSKDIKTMDDLFAHTLRDIYYAEKQIVQALPEMINKAGDPARF